MNFTPLERYLDNLWDIPGCDCVIYYQRQPVFRHQAGFSDHAKTTPVSGNEVYWMYSATKPLTAVASLQLMEQGKLGLDDPVARYLPAFDQATVREGDILRPAKIPITLRHLLSMQGGLSYRMDMPPVVEVQQRTKGRATTREIIDAMAKEPLSFDPSTHFQYSFCLDVMAAVIEQASGQTFRAYLQQHIFDPLGMKDSGLRMTPQRRSRLAAQYTYDNEAGRSLPAGDSNSFILSDLYDSGGAGLISTADDYIRFVDALCYQGEGANGQRILSKESVDLMRTNQLYGPSKADFDQLHRLGYSYGLGVRTLVEKEQSGARSPLGEFGWDSAGGAYLLADPDHHIALFYAQHVLGCNIAYDIIHPTIRDLTYDCLELA